MLWHVCRQHMHVVLQMGLNATYTHSTGWTASMHCCQDALCLTDYLDAGLDTASNVTCSELFVVLV